jgi:glutaredoxin
MKLFSRVILPILLIIYIAVETYAKLNNTSICGTTGCELAGELLRFDSLYLNYFGAAGAVAVMLFGWLSLKQKTFEKLFYITLYAAIAFESIMIAFQVLANPEPCIFCMGVYSGLLAIALFANWKYLLFAMPMILALFLSMGSLSIPKNQALISSDGNYLIHSESCPHCKKVKEYFAQEKIEYSPISIVDPSGRSLLKSLGYKQIPVLIVKKDNHIQIFKGDHDIMDHFKPNTSTSSSTQESSSINLSGANNDSGGCEASIFKAPSCEEDSIITQ